MKKDFKTSTKQPPPKSSKPLLSKKTAIWFCLSIGLVIAFATYWNKTPEKPSAVIQDFSLEPERVTKTLSIPEKSASTESSSSSSETTLNPQPHQQITHHEKTVTVKRGDSLAKIFKQLGLKASLLQEILSLKGAKNLVKHIEPGQNIRFVFDHNGNFKQMFLPYSETDTLIITNNQSILHLDHEQVPLTTKTRFANGDIQSSLYQAGSQAGVSDNIIMKLAAIFAWDIDFILDVRPNDSFRVVYETIYKEDKKLRDGAILFAEFVNQDKSYQAIRFTDKNGHSEYYTPDGKSVRKAFIRAPVDFTRISSHFNLKRKHPILHVIRAHKGVDYAAPQGTPVYASGDGKITYMGKKGGYGNAIVIEHGKKYSTLYAHLHRFAKGMYAGKRVKQQQLIGYVGKTGLATAPHLHYEFRVNGAHKNPVTVALPKANPISDADKLAFSETREQIFAQLEKLQTTLIAAEL